MNRLHGVLWGAVLALHATFAAAQPLDINTIERDVATAAAEAARVDKMRHEVPELFAVTDRDERATWGAIYHLNKEYTRASFALYGAIQPKPGEDVARFEASAEYAESLYFLADSLYELGNIGAARVYFERLLGLRRHDYHDEAILRLMAIAARFSQFDDVDRYYTAYLQVAGASVPGQVRYLRAKSLFQARRDPATIDELGRIEAGDAYDLRGRYLRAALQTRAGQLIEALATFDNLVAQKPVSAVDVEVKELATLGRARLLYELDRLDESIDAYQDIEFTSSHLTTMLYEVTLTYVRRGQMALHGGDQKKDGKTDRARKEAAAVEYKKALRQLDDLRALDPNGVRSADIDLLAGSLKLQLLEFNGAEELFGDVVARYHAADLELATLQADMGVRELVLKDILALEQDENAVLSSPLPPIAARRAAQNRDVARSLSVFKDLQRSRAEVEESEVILEQLDAMLSASNASRAELFAALQSVVGRSSSLANTVATLRSRAVALERTLARPDAAAAQQLQALAAKRGEIEQRIKSVPTTIEALTARKKRFNDQLDAAERGLHELELTNNRLRAGLAASEWQAQRELSADPTAREAARLKVRELGAEVDAHQQAIDGIESVMARLRVEVQTAGGRGSGEEQLRRELDATLREERTILAQVRQPSQASVGARLDALNARLDAIDTGNQAFRTELDANVDQRLGGVRTTISAERAALAGYRARLDAIDQQAAGLRDAATAVALDRVRRDIAQIVLRADVGIVDTAFARKQAETEQIGALERARAAALTDLTQAYADLTRDDLP